MYIGCRFNSRHTFIDQSDRIKSKHDESISNGLAAGIHSFIYSSIDQTLKRPKHDDKDISNGLEAGIHSNICSSIIQTLRKAKHDDEYGQN